MRNLKKFLALVLAMMMVFSLTLTVNAATFDDDKTITEEFKEAVEVLNGIGIMVGDGSGNFNPEKQIQRCEAAVIIYHLATGDVAHNRVNLYTYEGSEKFSDVNADDWFAGYVGYCANAGIALGNGEGEFMPYRFIDGYEMLTMLLRVVGYKDVSVFPGSEWRTQVASGATQLGILNTVKDTKYGGSLFVAPRRDVVAELTFQTATKVPEYINGTTFKWTTVNTEAHGSQLVALDNPTLAVKHWNLTNMTGVVVGNQATGEKNTLIGKTEVTYAKAADENATIATSGYDYTGAELVDDKGDAIEDKDSEKVLAETLALDLTTGLDKFGHMVKVWYKGGTTKCYAAIDKSNSTAVIWAGEEKNATESGAGKMGKFISDAGFTVPETITDLYVSDAFGAMVRTDDGTDVSGTKGNSGAYLLISNNSDDVLNVIVALDVSVDEIIARNEYTSPKTVTLDGFSDDVVAKRSVVKAKVAEDDVYLTYGEKAITVGAPVIANGITGTVTKLKDKDNADQNVSYLGIEKVAKKVTGKVVSLTTEGKATLNTGDVLEPSVLWNVANNIYADDQDLLLIGNTLNFFLDANGDYVGVSKDLNEPFMAAYGYWEQSGTSTIKYYIQGVTQKGVEVREEVTEESYKMLTADNNNPIPYLSTTLGENEASTSLSVTPAKEGTTGYTDMRVVDKEIEGANWDAFDSTTTLVKGDDRFTVDGAAKYLTDSTVYHVVTSFGDNLKIEKFVGLNNLLQGADSIVFDGYFFETEDDTEHTAGKNAVVSEALLVNVKRIYPTSFFFNHTAITDSSTPIKISDLKMTVDGKAIQHMMYVAGEKDEGAVLVSMVGTEATTDGVKNGPSARDEAATTADKFYLTNVDADGYNELSVVENSDPAGDKTYAYYSDTNGTDGVLSNANTAFGEIKIKKDQAGTENVVLKAGDAKVIDVSSTAKTNGIKDYATLRRAVEENDIKVAVLVTSAGGNVASVIYVTSCAAR